MKKYQMQDFHIFNKRDKIIYAHRKNGNLRIMPVRLLKKVESLEQYRRVKSAQVFQDFSKSSTKFGSTKGYLMAIVSFKAGKIENWRYDTHSGPNVLISKCDDNKKIWTKFFQQRLYYEDIIDGVWDIRKTLKA